ncbi:signal peptide peptidase SppA [Ruminococcaceae bacterium OttesenSCG-928-O06]|nr:signal peptide peptidase SppA [Ruminococcaceae bacterium OttesenSCG-928-O06]
MDENQTGYPENQAPQPPQDATPPFAQPMRAVGHAGQRGTGLGDAYPPPKRHRGRGMGIALIAVSLALIVLVGAFVVGLFMVGGSVYSLTRTPSYNNTPPQNSFSVLYVVGTIRNAGSGALGINEPSYQHSATVGHIRELAKNEDNLGILLYMNTGGGGVYESDEVYLALMDYKAQTGRPVWAYMADTCASGGYYICAAADYITANRNTTTGSIGVYISMTDTSGLYEKLGIETVLVRSGDNKGTGMQGVPITEEQRAVYQGVVDECYEQFIELVAEGRHLPLAQVRELADGRIYTARQALALGLIDELGDWDSARKAFEEECGGTAFYPNFSRQTALGSLLSGILGSLPKGETEASLEAAQRYPSGVPMALWDPALPAA